jgi:DMSO reductase family type II enzyme chaperone
MTSSAPPTDGQVVHAETRSAIYQALALGWRYPSQGAFQAYRRGQYLGDLLQLASSLPHLADLVAREDGTIDQVRDELAHMSFEVFEHLYVATFGGGSREPRCPPYEGLYDNRRERAAVIAEVTGFYRRCGLKPNRCGDWREVPDYLSVELELLAFLAYKEARMAQEGAEELLDGYRWAQKDFLERHMVGWLPVFAGKLTEEETPPFFPYLARLSIGFTRAELELLRNLAGADYARWMGAAVLVRDLVAAAPAR